MEAWLETVGVILVAVLGAFIGWRLSRRSRLTVLIGCAIPLVLVILVALSRRIVALNFVGPFTWLTAGRREFVILAFCGALLLVAPIARLHRRRERVLMRLLVIVAVSYFSVLPFLQPALLRSELATLQTQIDESGVCRQSFEYTCGPAAAVTALHRLGVTAQEGDIAILAHTSPIAGTAPDSLAIALEQQFGRYGVYCQYRWFNSIDDLDNNGVTLAVIRHGLLYDHFVAVLRVGRGSVVIGDPANGLDEWSRQEFEKVWRGSGVVVSLTPQASFWRQTRSLPQRIGDWLRGLFD